MTGMEITDMWQELLYKGANWNKCTDVLITTIASIKLSITHQKRQKYKEENQS